MLRPSLCPFGNPPYRSRISGNKRTLEQLSVVKGRTAVPLELEQKWEDNPMSTCQQTESARSNQYSESSVCNHCAGVTIHEPWCLTCNTVVRYAFEAALGTGHLTLGDELILHALGVEWGGRACEGQQRSGSRLLVQSDSYDTGG